MANSQTNVAVVYVCDINYHELTLYSLASIARSHRAPLDFFLMQCGYERPVPGGLQTMINSRGHRLTVQEAPSIAPVPVVNAQQAKYARPCDRLPSLSHITSTMFLKACAIDALSDRFDYILYLDGDILAFNDLHCDRAAGFTETAAACLDLSSAAGFDDPAIFENCRRHGVPPGFFNSGVIMINARKWRATRAADRFADNLLRHRDECPYFRDCRPNDQCAFNMTLGTDLKRLPTAWNVQKSALHTHAWETATIRHYTGPRKFLPIRLRTCNSREHTLLRSISREFGLPAPNGLYDFGAAYMLNKNSSIQGRGKVQSSDRRNRGWDILRH